MCDKVEIKFRLKTNMGIELVFEYLYKWKEEEQPRVSYQLVAMGKSVGTQIGDEISY